jgi:GTP-binding protein
LHEAFTYNYYNIGIANIAGLTFNLIDTGGLDDRGIVSIDIQDQIERSLIRSDIVLFMVDGKNGINTVDASYAQWIRKKLGAIDICFKRPSGMKREVILVSNKIEGGYMSDNVLNSFSEGIELGWGTPLLISASHGDGIAELAQEIVSAAKLRCLDNVDEEVVPVSSLSPMELSDRTIQMALMGRPNVGKSSLLNAILKDKRAITGPVPGLTRFVCH